MFPGYINWESPQILWFNNQKIIFTWLSDYAVKGILINDNRNTSELFDLYYFTNYTESYSTGIFNDKLYFVYSKPENGNEVNIWSNIKSTGNFSMKPEPFFTPHDKDILYDNYPNPFNASTKIVYSIRAYHKVKITVYDLLGMEVIVLVDGYHGKGIYETTFNASGFPSGIYFVKMDAFDVSIKKIVLVK